jgi:hypothetical protein
MWFAVLIASEVGEEDGENKCSLQLGARRQREFIVEDSGPRAQERHCRHVTTCVKYVLYSCTTNFIVFVVAELLMQQLHAVANKLL